MKNPTPGKIARSLADIGTLSASVNAGIPSEAGAAFLSQTDMKSINTEPLIDFGTRANDGYDPAKTRAEAEKKDWQDFVYGNLCGTDIGIQKVRTFLLGRYTSIDLAEKLGLCADEADTSLWRQFTHLAKDVRDPRLDKWFDQNGELDLIGLGFTVPRMSKDTLRTFRSADRKVEVVLLCTDDESLKYEVFYWLRSMPDVVNSVTMELLVESPSAIDDLKIGRVLTTKDVDILSPLLEKSTTVH